MRRAHLSLVYLTHVIMITGGSVDTIPELKGAVAGTHKLLHVVEGWLQTERDTRRCGLAPGLASQGVARVLCCSHVSLLSGGGRGDGGLSVRFVLPSLRSDAALENMRPSHLHLFVVFGRPAGRRRRRPRRMGQQGGRQGMARHPCSRRARPSPCLPSTWLSSDRCIMLAGVLHPRGAVTH